MIHINLWAVLSVLIIVCLGLGLNNLLPGLFAGPYKNFAVSILVVLVGSVAQVFGIRGRIFFISIWVIGIGMVTYHAYALWGISGIVILLTATALCLWWMVKASERREAEQWARAAVSISELRSVGDCAEDAPKFWTLVRDSLFLPVTGTYTALVCSHDLEVIKIVLEKALKSSSVAELAPWQGFEALLKENANKKSGNTQKQTSTALNGNRTSMNTESNPFDYTLVS